MSFLRRLSSAILPAAPNAQGVPASHVPRRATETSVQIGNGKTVDSDESSFNDVASRASWELSDAGSSERATSSGSESEGSEDGDTSDSDSDYDDPRSGRSKDKYDVMVRHLWNTADREGWFRDARFDGLVSLR